MKDIYQKAMEVWEVPEEFYEAAAPMYREYEVRLAGKMGRAPALGQTICSWLEEWEQTDGHRLLFESYQRNVLEKCEEKGGEDVGYRMTNFYDRYPIFAQFQPEVYAGYSQEMVDRLNDWDLKVYMGCVSQAALDIASGKNVPMHQTQYLTLEESYEMVDGFGEEVLVVPCNCKAMGRCIEKPVDVCMGRIQEGQNTFADRKLGKRISSAEAKELILRANQKGLMQSGERDWLCNCDGVYCYPTKMARILKTRLGYPASHYEILWDSDACVQCGKCTQVCNHKAFYKDGQGKIVYDTQKCWGCTICAPNCPRGAITLKKRTHFIKGEGE